MKGTSFGTIKETQAAAKVPHDERHDLVLYVWSNGKCIVTEGRHPKMVAMAAVYWRTKFSELGFSTS